MTYPKTYFIHSHLNGARRIAQTALNIKNGFYVRNGFYVLPRLVRNSARTIYFPKLPYGKIPLFWSKIQDANVLDENRKTSSLFINQIAVLLQDKPIKTAQLETQWKKCETHFWKLLYSLFPSIASHIQEIELRITRFGSIATGFSTWTSRSKALIVYVRNDADVSHVAEAILTDLFHSHSQISQHYSWRDMESIIDFLICHSNIRFLFYRYKATTNALKQLQQGDLKKESDAYLKKLGISQFTDTITADKKSIRVRRQSIGGALASQEYFVLLELIEEKNRLVTFDRLANVLWREKADESYSLYAIAKVIERIRKKLALFGVSPDVIQTVKKRGYILFDSST